MGASGICYSVIFLTICYSEAYGPALLQEVNAAIDRLHGTMEDREKTGRLAIENNGRANRVQGGRSYALGLSFQQTRSRVTANLGDKFSGTEDEELVSRQKILEVNNATYL
jgi:hypothetical protein